MAFNPEEERRRGALESGMLGGSPLGGMLSAGGTFVPQLNPFARGMSSPYMPSQTYPGAGGKPMMFPTYQDAMDYYIANPSPGLDRPNPANWTTPSSPSPTGATGQADAAAGELAMKMDNAKTEAWWAAQPRPSFVPADWVYIGMGDWGPPDVYGPGGTEGPPLAGPPMPTAENPLIPGSTYSGPAGALPPGLLGPVPGVS